MPYPDEILERLAGAYPALTAALSAALRDRLMIPEIRAAVEGGRFPPADLLLELRAPGGGAAHVTVFSSPIAQAAVAEPSVLGPLRAHIVAHWDAWREWEAIENDTEALARMHVNHRMSPVRWLLSRHRDIGGFLAGHPLLIQASAAIVARLEEHSIASTTPLEEAVRAYFQQLLVGGPEPPIVVEFQDKPGGVHVGVKMVVTYQVPGVAGGAESRRAAFYIKTHQYGCGWDFNSTKPVDPKELLVYRILEYIGWGPKAWFFSDLPGSGGNEFYIAAEDVTFTPKIEKQKTLTLFEAMKARCNAAPRAPQYEDARRAFMAINLLSYILRLRDTIENPENVGRLTIQQGGRERLRWKVLDFRVAPATEAHLYLDQDIYLSFTMAYLVYPDEHADFLRAIFSGVHFNSANIALAADCMAELEIGRGRSRGVGRRMSFLEAVRRAHGEIQEYVRLHHASMGVDAGRVLADLTRYVSAIGANFIFLHAGLIRRQTVFEEADVRRSVARERAVAGRGDPEGGEDREPERKKLRAE